MKSSSLTSAGWQGAGDPGEAVAGQPLGEHPCHDRRGVRIGVQAVRPPAPRRVGLVGVRAGVGEPVPVRRPAAQVPALLPGLRRHRGHHPDPRPGDLTLGLHAEGDHRLVVTLGPEVDPASGFRGPQLDAEMLEQRCRQGVLRAVERPLILADHDRVEPAFRICHRDQQHRCLRAALARQHPALPGVEVLGHDLPCPATSIAAWSRCRARDVTGSW